VKEHKPFTIKTLLPFEVYSWSLVCYYNFESTNSVTLYRDVYSRDESQESSVNIGSDVNRMERKILI